MKKLIQAKYVVIFAITLLIMMFVLFSMISIFYMDRGYTIPVLFLIVIAVVLIQKSEKEDHLF
ncbi:hypothetical protein [Cytophaga hutchinsonii]|uniref:Uncharacterized protein n=1 Tax=Cytophaga hutchinsonii (strain ATCC 33406 / DSM 1761 / CIP 103989 / NBRC 15051 / NCIMB 9469 / D465) TaxID=269798 RepID=A0A6N4SW15_CYTH3|nr:hypothetical protein [Cytophaga hutchinsonii]ABG60481.1 hypothetical protein CHU_3241 [Cytophaga hutchinsonii ATCC 33406]SFX85023.1 hypothetical protein SAMN04487930_11138 [Cytophaga hutchinsonii ATCC 33406]